MVFTDSSTPSDAQLAQLLSKPGKADNKYTRGVVGIWAGSQTYPGAAVLSTSAAVRTGAGLVRLLAPQRVEDLVLARRPEVVVADGFCHALVLGPGVDPQDRPRVAQVSAALTRARAQHLPAVIDAGALTLLGSKPLCSAYHLLTPHAGEAARLLNQLGCACSRAQVEQDGASAAQTLANLTGACVVLKGASNFLASPQTAEKKTSTQVWRLPGGPAWLASAGSGDVLAGIMGAICAQVAARQGDPLTIDPLACAGLAVRIHALAGWVAMQQVSGNWHPNPGSFSSAAVCAAPTAGAQAPIAALDLCAAIPAVIAQLLT